MADVEPAEDRYGLQRFVEAQNRGRTYEQAVRELRSGLKSSHWMWFVFPQVAGLGRSPTAQHYAIGSLGEARAYLRHPVLGPRLRECAEIAASIDHRTAADVFGSVDAMKLRSSMTLFDRAAPEEPVFGRVLDRFFDGTRDELTEMILGGSGGR
ncbi:MAG TPA: DUF1810 domain-containing protein [Jatrophihabitans sp.]|nr:DUF1810 domain-containing protein [Jatrophihabitans sp.]